MRVLLSPVLGFLLAAGAARAAVVVGLEVLDPATPPPAAPALLAPGIVDTGFEERDLAFDGDRLVWTRVGPRTALLLLDRDDAGWGLPRLAPFSGLHDDLEPAFTPDGRRLWFCSRRPGGEEEGDYDLWYVEPDGPGWTDPIRPGPPLNGPGNEFYPSVSRNGTVYFTAEREGGVGGEDIWRCRPADDGWTAAECLEGGVSTPGPEFNAFVAPDESYLLFSRWMREGDFGGGDLYASFRRPDGAWTEAANLGPAVNTGALEYCPSVSPDGRLLFFTRRGGRQEIEHPTGEPLDLPAFTAWSSGPGNGLGDVYVIDAALLDSLRAENLGR